MRFIVCSIPFIHSVPLRQLRRASVDVVVASVLASVVAIVVVVEPSVVAIGRTVMFLS